MPELHGIGHSTPEMLNDHNSTWRYLPVHAVGFLDSGLLYASPYRVSQNVNCAEGRAFALQIITLSEWHSHL